jgi:hypothetical protein
VCHTVAAWRSTADDTALSPQLELNKQNDMVGKIFAVSGRQVALA